MKKLRLILLPDCNRNCEGCCNKQWDLDSLEVERNFSQYSEVLITGGEPMLRPDLILEAVATIREDTEAPIYVYTADVRRLGMARCVLDFVDGMTVTLHEQSDAKPFWDFTSILRIGGQRKSLRLNIFKGVRLNRAAYGWKIKDNIEWIDPCPLPRNEVLRRWQS